LAAPVPKSNTQSPSSATKKVEVSAWDALTVHAHDHLRKGCEGLVAGIVESGHYTDRQGNSVDTLKLTAQVVKFWGSRCQ
jgi:single-stranded DNA-binding protein